jgi:hypothetical protein
MIVTKSAFAVKERLEELEEKVDKFLDSKGLQEFARSYSEKILQSTLEESKSKIEKETDSAIAKLQETKLELDTEFELSKKDLAKVAENSAQELKKLQRNSRLVLVTISALSAIAQLAISYFTN